MWGIALAGTVRSLPVVLENRKEVVFPSPRVQHEYDEDFLYGRLLNAVNFAWRKINGQKVDFQPANQKISSCSVRGLFIMVLFFFRSRMGISHFRTGTLFVLLSQI